MAPDIIFCDRTDGNKPDISLSIQAGTGAIVQVPERRIFKSRNPRALASRRVEYIEPQKRGRYPDIVFPVLQEETSIV